MPTADTLELVDIDEVFLQNLRRRMDELQWEVPELSKKSGISSSYLYNVMKRERWPSPPYLARIASAVGRSVSELFSEKKPPTHASVFRVSLYQAIASLDDKEVQHVLSAFIEPLLEAKSKAIKKEKNSS